MHFWTLSTSVKLFLVNVSLKGGQPVILNISGSSNEEQISVNPFFFAYDISQKELNIPKHN